MNASSLKNLTGKQVVKLLEEQGWVQDHVTGSHYVMRKGGVSLPVPVHHGRTLKQGTLHRILRDAGLK